MLLAVFLQQLIGTETRKPQRYVKGRMHFAEHLYSVLALDLFSVNVQAEADGTLRKDDVFYCGIMGNDVIE